MAVLLAALTATPAPAASGAAEAVGADNGHAAAAIPSLLAAETVPLYATGRPGYLMLDAAGVTYGFGSAAGFRSNTNGPAVAVAGSRGGAWVLHADGTVVGVGAVQVFGKVDLGRLRPGERLTAIAGLDAGTGYWVFTDRGQVFPFGATAFLGDMRDVPLNGPIIAAAVTRTGGQGYWMVGADGGIFSFGAATFAGSMGGRPLNRPVVGIAADPDGSGYWLVASDGGIFAFDAEFRGSLPGVLQGRPLNKPVVGALGYGNGYLMVASDGGIFSFSDAPFLGSLGAFPPESPVIGVAIRPHGALTADLPTFRFVEDGGTPGVADVGDRLRVSTTIRNVGDSSMDVREVHLGIGTVGTNRSARTVTVDPSSSTYPGMPEVWTFPDFAGGRAITLSKEVVIEESGALPGFPGAPSVVARVSVRSDQGVVHDTARVTGPAVAP